MSLQEIVFAIEANEAEQVRLNELKWTHPVYIEQKLGPCPLAASVTRVEPVTGWTDSRKNPCPYRGFKFVLDGVQYEAARGSNWCSSFTQVEQLGSALCDELPNWEEYVDDDGFLKEDLYESLPPHEAVGLALLYRNGVVG